MISSFHTAETLFHGFAKHILLDEYFIQKKKKEKKGTVVKAASKVAETRNI